MQAVDNYYEMIERIHEEQEMSASQKRELERLYEDAFSYAYEGLEPDSGMASLAFVMFKSYLMSCDCSQEEIEQLVDWLGDDDRFEE